MARYISIPPAQSLNVPGVTQPRWIDIAVPDNLSDNEAYGQLGMLGIGFNEAKNFAISPPNSPVRFHAVPVDSLRWDHYPPTPFTGQSDSPSPEAFGPNRTTLFYH